MNVTQIIDGYASASPKIRFIVAVTIGILCYAGFRFMIYKFNKIAKEVPQKKHDWKDNLKSMAGQD